MNKLTISHSEIVNAQWMAIRFQGDNDAFRSMDALLHRQRDYNAYWSASVFEARGGWIVRLAWLKHYKRCFHNLDRALVVGQRRVVTEELKK
ncbi:MAG TPA: hypothetical protein VHV10_06490 [Ktedonobacteraceae bacterium]|nr:hypothetical protein [Ktedonobacteraceae bacterium]